MVSLPTLATTGPDLPSRLHPATEATAKPASNRAENLVFMNGPSELGDGWVSDHLVNRAGCAIHPSTAHLPSSCKSDLAAARGAAASSEGCSSTSSIPGVRQYRPFPFATRAASR